jgi:hypothetical protein
MICRSIREAYLLRCLAVGVVEKGFELGDRRPRLRPHVRRCQGARDRQEQAASTARANIAFLPVAMVMQTGEDATIERTAERGAIYKHREPWTWQRE